MPGPSRTPTTGAIRVQLFDSSGAQFDFARARPLVVVATASAVYQRTYLSGHAWHLTGVSPKAAPGGNFRVMASADGYIQAGAYPVAVSAGQTTEVSLMLVPKKSQLNFHEVTWNRISMARPELADFVRRSVQTTLDPGDAYSELLERNPLSLACFLNIWAIASNLRFVLPNRSLNSYLHSALSLDDKAFKQDRVLLWCERSLVDELGRSPAFQKAPAGLHKGATCSFKEITHDVANLQVCFHENDSHPELGSKLIKVELDIDYYKSALPHLMLEVAPNHLTGGLTQPQYIYPLRWMAHRKAGASDFDPLFRIISAEA